MDDCDWLWSAEGLDITFDERRCEFETRPVATAVKRRSDSAKERARTVTEIVVRGRTDVGIKIEVDFPHRTLDRDVPCHRKRLLMDTQTCPAGRPKRRRLG